MDAGWLAGAGASVAGLGVAMAVGLSGSLHCAAMCGPLACASVGPEPAPRLVLAWQAGRLAGYGLLGALAGLAGDGLLRLLDGLGPSTLGWLAAATLLLSAAGLLDRLRLPSGAKIVRLGRRTTSGIAVSARSAIGGILTALLPCGLLPAVWVAAAATGSAGWGATLAVAFGLGAVPSTSLAMVGGGLVRGHPRAARVFARAVPAVAAVLVAVRTLQAPELPLCH